MAIRSFPADNRLQAFITESYENEMTARLRYFSQTHGGIRSTSGDNRRRKGGPVVDGLPAIHPSKFALRMKLEEEESKRRLAEYTSQLRCKEEMLRPAPTIKAKLYDGFTKEGKGRLQYLNTRKLVIPEQKYNFPITSSWDYGWKLGDTTVYRRPTFARTPLIRDSFFTDNGVPTLSNPHMLRSHTAI